MKKKEIVSKVERKEEKQVKTKIVPYINTKALPNLNYIYNIRKELVTNNYKNRILLLYNLYSQRTVERVHHIIRDALICKYLENTNTLIFISFLKEVLTIYNN